MTKKIFWYFPQDRCPPLSHPTGALPHFRIRPGATGAHQCRPFGGREAGEAFTFGPALMQVRKAREKSCSEYQPHLVVHKFALQFFTSS